MKNVDISTKPISIRQGSPLKKRGVKEKVVKEIKPVKVDQLIKKR
jgi:hypothetical protein